MRSFYSTCKNTTSVFICEWFLHYTRNYIHPQRHTHTHAPPQKYNNNNNNALNGLIAALCWIAAKTKHIACNVFQQCLKCYCCKQYMHVCEYIYTVSVWFFSLLLQAIYDAKFRVRVCAYIKHFVSRQPWQSARRNWRSCKRVANTQRRSTVYTMFVWNNVSVFFMHIHIHIYILYIYIWPGSWGGHCVWVTFRCFEKFRNYAFKIFKRKIFTIKKTYKLIILPVISYCVCIIIY